MNIETLIDKHIRADVTALVQEDSGCNFVPGSVSSFETTKKIRERLKKAKSLSAPFLDYEAAARAEGWKWSAELELWTLDSPGFSGSHPDAEAVCSAMEIEPHEIPVISHYIVTAELADKLEARGERVERDFGGVIVWARKKPEGSRVTHGGEPWALEGDPVLLSIIECETWTGSPCPRDPDNFWIDDKTGERVNAKTGQRVSITTEEWSSEDNEASTAEGWLLSVAIGSQYILEGAYDIQKADDIGLFNSGDAAIAHVKAKADAGSELHLKALRLHGKINPHGSGSVSIVAA